MSDLNWCTFCDNAISRYSDSLYCSESCLKSDALRNHPLLGYNYSEFINFPRPYHRNQAICPIEATFNIPSQPNTPSSSPTLTAVTSTSNIGYNCIEQLSNTDMYSH
ncbi:hypothetical protein BDB01DRAFT_781543 [Pilobolus umbonatus]|nr:hypothetical protein BDB01DRAFT_781543 [Pilobolus umbonatus]